MHNPKSKFDKLFEQDFDISEPSLGHFNRFERLLENQNTAKSTNNTNWKWISFAASIALIFGIWFGQSTSNEGLELADVSPQMEETQTYFTSLIRSEIEKVNSEKNTDNETMIKDAFKQLDVLEKHYADLTIELKNSNADKRIIFAMVSNFQQRIEVLQNLLEQIDNNKQLKTTTYENFS